MSAKEKQAVTADGNARRVWKDTPASTAEQIEIGMRASIAAGQQLSTAAREALAFVVNIIGENAEPDLESCVDVRESLRIALERWEKANQ
jgi:hypothetical protein